MKTPKKPREGPAPSHFAAAEESGEGLPYAPENWPEMGDIWGWRTGRRVTMNGTFHDRYLYLPLRLCQPSSSENSGGASTRKRKSFPSKLAVERYIKENFLDADVNAFFASFTWKIPAVQTNGNVVPIAAIPLQQIAQVEESDSNGGTVGFMCKGSNKMCDSLKLEGVEKDSPAMPCDLCCAEPRFCRDCCCLLCSKTVSSDYGGYSYIKCQINVGGGICGHVAHLECALRSLSAGKVGRNIGLDAEYHCYRCDGKTDLTSHVYKLLNTCEDINLDETIRKKILNLGACLLRGSQKPIAQVLLTRIEMAIQKVDDDHATHSAGMERRGINMKRKRGLFDNGNDVIEVDNEIGTISYNSLPKALKLEAEVDEVLQALRKSQELEYKVAEERIQAQKTYLQNLYQQLECEKSELACQNSSSTDVLEERNQQIRKEVEKFEAMKKVANGFARTPKDILKEHFDLANDRLDY
ncbi:protein OBERON 1-like isoform X3 [Lotus japonicus]|uniref:protein OBERON 1-like isoform X3 n=1 Tax=Lotus japonicus TaxID=34305 RepID=UPI00258722DB|nr:protein OBERON 1-like isoform X3 [Lotus japonicus]